MGSNQRSIWLASGPIAIVFALVLVGIFLRHGSSIDKYAVAGLQAASVASVAPDADQFGQCEESVTAQNWDAAIRACSELYGRDPDYSGLASHLAAAYVGRGRQRLAGGDDLTAAAADLEDALGYQPGSEEAQRAWQQLYLYQEGNKALSAGDWERAINRFSAAYAQGPDYLQSLGDRSLEAKLFTAWLAWGETALRADAKASAAQRCKQALALVPADPEARRCMEAAANLANGTEAADELLANGELETLSGDETVNSLSEDSDAADESAPSDVQDTQSSAVAVSGRYERAARQTMARLPITGGPPDAPVQLCCSWQADASNRLSQTGRSATGPNQLCVADYSFSGPLPFLPVFVPCMGGPGLPGFGGRPANR